jgi:hypothetical protein
LQYLVLSLPVSVAQYLVLSLPVSVAQPAGGAECSEASTGTDCSAGVPQTPAPDAVQTSRGRLRHGEFRALFTSEKTRTSSWDGGFVSSTVTDKNLIRMVSDTESSGGQLTTNSTGRNVS